MFISLAGAYYLEKKIGYNQQPTRKKFENNIIQKFILHVVQLHCVNILQTGQGRCQLLGDVFRMLDALRRLICGR